MITPLSTIGRAAIMAAAGASVLALPFVRAVITVKCEDEVLYEWWQQRAELVSFLTVALLAVGAETMQIFVDGGTPDMDIPAFILGAATPFIARFLARNVEFGIDK